MHAMGRQGRCSARRFTSRQRRRPCACNRPCNSRLAHAPASVMAANADWWQFLPTSRVSPGPATDMTAAWMPTLLPLIRNQVRRALNSWAASCWDSRMTPVGEVR